MNYDYDYMVRLTGDTLITTMLSYGYESSWDLIRLWTGKNKEVIGITELQEISDAFGIGFDCFTFASELVF